jgi:hypothetical protein
MNVNLLIDNIVRQTTLCLYQGLSVIRRQLEQGGMSVADIRGEAS